MSYYMLCYIQVVSFLHQFYNMTKEAKYGIPKRENKPKKKKKGKTTTTTTTTRLAQQEEP